MKDAAETVRSLIGSDIVIVSIGLDSLGDELEHQEAAVVTVAWKPNVDNDPDLAWDLAEMGA